MSSFFDIFIGLVASYFATSLESFYKTANHTEWYLIYAAPLLSAGLIILILLALKSYILYSNRPLKKYEGFWIETITDSIHSNEDLVSIMKIYYKKNEYVIVGKTEYMNGSGCLATWKSEKVFLYDKENLELDYIYKADFMNDSSQTRGYAKIQLKHRLGFIIDIDQNPPFEKQSFQLTKVTKDSDIDDFDASILIDANKSSFKKFMDEYN